LYLSKTPKIIQSITKDLHWKLKGSSEGRQVYLTFDDGPIPDVTTWVLDLLRAHHILATFFCIGKNVAAHPEIYQRIIREGHVTGNHTFNHLSGYKNSTVEYMHDIALAAQHIDSNLFRPPYGRIKKGQIKAVSQQYNIVMWDVLSGDFDTKISTERCVNNVINNVENGSVIVFHDSIKAFRVLKKALPQIIESLKESGYAFSTISENLFANKQ
jgi:peptidoglycan/xylan/chitin deacetylase (PgdA/CDA1 family)